MDFKNDWNSYYGDFDLDSLIKDKGSDEKGRYIVFYDGLIEQKFKTKETYQRIGPWGWNAENHINLREVRGLLVFAVWVSNTDLKESENNKLILRKTKKGPKFFKVVQDMGLTFGNILGEKPVNLKWSPIKKVKKNKIELKYLNIQDNRALENVTEEDARWMVRKIAKLTRKQINDAVSIGGWPDKKPFNLHQLLVEKLISRRNAMVKAFGLSDEFEPLPFTKMKMKKVPSKIGDYTIDFSHELVDLTRGPIKRIPHVIVDLMRAGIGAISKIDLDPVEIGLDDGFISQFLFKLNRKVIRNPNPRTEDETFIIQDKFLFGVRFGFGVVLSGDVAKYREYNLIHTARTRDEAKYKGNFFLNLALPVQVFLEKLPKNHILTVGNYLETRGRVKLEAATGLSLGTEGSVSRINLGRTIVSRGDEELVFFDDKSNFNQAAWRLFAKAGIIKIPFATTKASSGKIDRHIYRVNENNLGEDEVKKAITKALEDLDFEDIKKVATPQKIESTFIEKNFNINLIGLVGRKKETRSDDIIDYGLIEGPEDDRYFFQLEKSNEFFWNSFLSKETFSETAQIIVENDRDENIIDSVLKLDYLHHDKRVTSKELEEVYLPFLNSVSRDKLLDFSPDAHSSNDEWGKMNLRLRMEIYKSGLEKIRRMTKSELNTLAKEVMGSSDDSKFKFRGKKYSKRKFKKDLKRFWKKMDKARLKKDDKNLAAKSILESIYKNVKLRNGAYSALLLQVLTRHLDKEDYYVEASFYPEEFAENKLPERVVPFNVEGKKRQVKPFSFLTNLEDTLNIYEHFVK